MALLLLCVQPLEFPRQRSRATHELRSSTTSRLSCIGRTVSKMEIRIDHVTNRPVGNTHEIAPKLWILRQSVSFPVNAPRETLGGRRLRRPAAEQLMEGAVDPRGQEDDEDDQEEAVDRLRHAEELETEGDPQPF